MPRHVRPLGWLALAVALALAGRVAAVAPEIRDEGKFFSPEAVKKANEQIREIFRKHGKDLLIETYNAVPADQLEKVKAMNNKEKEEFFRNEAVSRAKQRVVKGIYLLITREPRYLYMEITPDARGVFGRETYNHVREILFSNFGQSHFDEGLANAVKAVADKLGDGGEK
jgi:protein-disulfide isomerase